MLRIGFVGADNGHCTVYAGMFNGAKGTDALGIPAAVTHYWAAEDGRWPEKEAEFCPKLDALGVERVARREEMIGKVDGVIVMGNYNEVNPERAQPFVEAKVPIFADKVLCNELEPAKAFAREVTRFGTPLISHSALRFVPEVLDIQRRREVLGTIYSGVFIGPSDLMDYGMHTVEPALAVFGNGVEWVYNYHDEHKDMAVLTYPDGRAVVVHIRRCGTPEPRWRFSYFAEKESGQEDVSLTDIYANSIREVLRLFAGQRQGPPISEMLETIAVIRAMRESGKTGQRIHVPELLAV
jgi:predicted dehydrogenase